MLTIVGQMLDRVGIAAQHQLSDNLQRLEYRAWHTDPDALRPAQPPRIPLTLDHRQQIGEVLSLRRQVGGNIYAVAVTDLDQLADFDAPIYFSPRIDAREHDGGDGVILEVAVTDATARIGARPGEIIRGDVRSLADRQRWALRDGLAKALVDFTVAELRHRRPQDPIPIRDAAVEKMAGRPAGDYRPWEAAGRQPVRYGPPGRVLSVR